MTTSARTALRTLQRRRTLEKMPRLSSGAGETAAKKGEVLRQAEFQRGTLRAAAMSFLWTGPDPYADQSYRTEARESSAKPVSQAASEVRQRATSEVQDRMPADVDSTGPYTGSSPRTSWQSRHRRGSSRIEPRSGACRPPWRGQPAPVLRRIGPGSRRRDPRRTLPRELVFLARRPATCERIPAPCQEYKTVPPSKREK
jgi:hypothetical protein